MQKKKRNNLLLLLNKENPYHDVLNMSRQYRLFFSFISNELVEFPNDRLYITQNKYIKKLRYSFLIILFSHCAIYIKLFIYCTCVDIQRSPKGK